MSIASIQDTIEEPPEELSLLNLAALDSAKLQRDPFDYLVAPSLIQTEPLTSINQDYPSIDTPGNLSLDGLVYGPAFEQLIREVTSKTFARRVGDKFGLDLLDCPITITVRKFCEASDGNIHTDHWSKVLTGILYFNQDWVANEGRLRMLRSKSDIEDYAAEVPPAGGTFLAFLRTDRSFHGHKRFVGERRMMQVNWLRSSKLAQAVQQIDRFSTRLMKRALRVTKT